MLRSEKQARQGSRAIAREGAPSSYGARRAFFVRRALRGLLIASCAVACVSASRGASAQAPYTPPGQYTPYGQPGNGQYSPYGQPYAQPGPYAQPTPYGSSPQAAPGYVALGGGGNDLTSDRAHSWIILRGSAGVGVHLADRLRPRPLAAAVIDATAGYRWAFSPRWSLAFEGGYSFDSEPGKGGMYGTIGAGPELYLHRYVQIGWDPKFVIGGAWSGLAIGVRNTLIVPLFMHVASFELGHQYLRVGAEDRHEIRAQVGFDVGGLLQLVITRTLSR